MQQFTRSIHLSGPPSADEVRMIAEGVRTSLGLQTITVNGVSPKSHFAQVLVEADYRMKLIGIGLETPPVKLVSYVDRAKLSDVSRNALQRWYFLPDYQCVRESDDKYAMELVGDGVKLVGEDELVTAGGQRKTTIGRGNKASRAFVTQLHQEVSRTGRTVARLRRIAEPDRPGHRRGLHPAAGLLRPGRLEDGTVRQRTAFPVETYDIPKTVESAVNAIWQNHTLGTPVGGGVQIQPAEAIDRRSLERREGQGQQAPRVDQAQPGPGPVVVGLSGISHYGGADILVCLQDVGSWSSSGRISNFHGGRVGPGMAASRSFSGSFTASLWKLPVPA